MRYILCLLIGAALAYGYVHYIGMSSSSDEGVKTSQSGLVHYGKEVLSSLKGNGFVTLEGTTIKGLLEVNGRVEAQEATIGELDVSGAASLTKCTVAGKSKVNGLFNATKTTFFDEINVASQKITLSSCSAPSILIREIRWIPGSEIIELKKKTQITGNITFESGKGKVILSDESSILGSVIGGEIERK